MRGQRADGVPVAGRCERWGGGVVSTFGELTPRERSAWELRNTIRRVAHDVRGAEIAEEPVEGYRVLTTKTLDDPLAGVRAAVLARDVAEGQMLTYAEEARGTGRSWDEVAEVAEALRIESTEDDAPRAEQAYLLLVEGRPLPVAEPPSWWHRPAARWTCTSCGQRVTDHGPFESHPDDVEQGHVSSCGTALRHRHSTRLDRG